MAKGSNFERKIAKDISLWWTYGEEDDCFWRSQGSGARATVRAKSGKFTKGQNGDICAVDSRGEPLTNLVTIELKKGYNSWNIKELLDTNKKNSILLSFIEQCERQKKESGCEYWLLITRQDRRNILVFFDRSFIHFLRNNKIHINDFDFIKFHVNKITHFCVRYEDFFKLLKPEIFKEVK
jgi:hypothetical protein